MVKEEVRKGREPRGQTVMSFFADTKLDELEMHRARAAASLLGIRLRDILREELGGTYGVSVAYDNSLPQHGLRLDDRAVRQRPREHREAHGRSAEGGRASEEPGARARTTSRGCRSSSAATSRRRRKQNCVLDGLAADRPHAGLGSGRHHAPRGAHREADAAGAARDVQADTSRSTATRS